MGIFTRMRDIVSSNINTMLEKAEDPEKLVKLMIQEMEDTGVEIKASCAGAMAERKKTGRALESAREAAEKWERNAALAVEKGREDLAREALAQKRAYRERAEAFGRELSETDAVIEQYKEDIAALEEKLALAREKHRVLVQRHIHARKKKAARQSVRRMETSDAFARFEDFRNRIERMEAEADLVDYARRPSLDEEFAGLQADDQVEAELEALKKKVGGRA